MLTPFTKEDADRAYDEWGMNCGPGALAAIMGMNLDEVRLHIGTAFDRKHYTNPSMMNDALRSIGRPWRKIGAEWPRYGLARIQWEGPWTGAGVPMRARYRYTHWVGVCKSQTTGIFDINCMNNGTGWCSLDDWVLVIVPYLTAQYPRATGGWHITHAIEIEKSQAKITRTVLSFPGDPDLELLPVEAEHKM
jgi:hypothetical protein